MWTDHFKSTLAAYRDTSSSRQGQTLKNFQKQTTSENQIQAECFDFTATLIWILI